MPATAPLSLTPPLEVTNTPTDPAHRLPGPTPTPWSQQVLVERAADHVARLLTLDHHSPELDAFTHDVDAIGNQTITVSAELCAHLLSGADSNFADTGAAGTPVDVALTDLRRSIDGLDPAQLTRRRKLLGLIPVGDPLTDYLRGVDERRGHIDHTLAELTDTRDELRKDNVVLAHEKTRLWDLLGELNQHIVLVEELDRAATAALAALAALEGPDPERATALRGTAEHSIRRKLQDLLAHQAVTAQSHLAIDLVITSNTELSAGIHRATTTTAAAMQTAQALITQKLIGARVRGAADASTALAARASQVAESAGDHARQQAGLTEAFQSIYETMRDVEQHRTEAAEAYGSTVAALRTDLARATTTSPWK